MPYRAIKATAVSALVVVLAGCQTAPPVAGDPATFQYDALGSASAKLNAQLNAEATAFGTAQGVAGIASASDPTGLSAIPLMVGGGIAHRARLAKNDALMKAAAEEDLQAAYKKYGMNSDGTPSGKRGPGSAP